MRIILLLTFILINVSFGQPRAWDCAIPGKCRSSSYEHRIEHAILAFFFSIVVIAFLPFLVLRYFETPEEREKWIRRMEREEQWEIEEEEKERKREERKARRLERRHEKAEREYKQGLK